MWVLSNSLNLLWVQILTIFFLLLVIADLAFILIALSIRFKRFKPMDQDGYDIQDSDRNIQPIDTEASAQSLPKDPRTSGRGPVSMPPPRVAQIHSPRQYDYPARTVAQ